MPSWSDTDEEAAVRMCLGVATAGGPSGKSFGFGVRRLHYFFVET
jgi:hypothetical protein